MTPTPRRARVLAVSLACAALAPQAACTRNSTASQARSAEPERAREPSQDSSGSRAAASTTAPSSDAGTSAQPAASATAPTLPAPFHTPSARNPPRIAQRPAGFALTAPQGFRVSEYARGFQGARWLALAPNGDVFVSDHEANTVYALRDADGDGRAELRREFARGLNQPFGMAFHPSGYLYVANTDSVVRFRYASGQLQAQGAGPERITDLPGEGYNQHWTRNVTFSPDGRRMFVTVGSETNADVEADPRRAAISAYDPDGRNHRVFAGGLRNPIGLAFHPATGVLFTVVNERDELGDDLVPDYLTSVREGAFYGWPYAYFGAHEDPRRRGERPDLVARTVVPDLALGAHVAALGLVFYTGTQFPAEYRGDAFVALHGSWNRARRSGYRVVRVRFADGRPTGQVTDFLTGFMDESTQRVYGRPAGLLQLQDGSLLVVDDATQVIYRVAYAG